jgi:hypothetical protein
MAEAGYDEINVDPVSAEAAAALSHSDFDLSELGSYSDMKINIMEISAGGDYMLSDSIGLNFVVKYYLYDDEDPVIWDQDGDMFLVWGGMKFVL